MPLEEVPPGSDNRTIQWLRDLRDLTLDLEKRLLAGVDDGGGDDGQLFSRTFEPIYEGSRATLAGTAEGTATEDAWTTIASGAPSGARYAMIQFYVDGNGDTDQGTVKWRTSNGAQEVTAVGMVQDYQTHFGSPHFVRLTDSGDFDYIADTTLGAFTWKIYRIGYVV